jgi:hypothetical protein
MLEEICYRMLLFNSRLLVREMNESEFEAKLEASMDDGGKRKR